MPMKDWAKLPAATEQSSVDQKLYFVLSDSVVLNQSARTAGSALTCDSIEKGLCPSTILKCLWF